MLLDECVLHILSNNLCHHTTNEVATVQTLVTFVTHRSHVSYIIILNTKKKINSKSSTKYQEYTIVARPSVLM